MTFANRLKATVEAVEASAQNEQAKQYLAVLHELVKGLEELGVGARIDPHSDPRTWTLYVHPPYRPQRGSRMLRFFLDGAEVSVSGATTTQVKSSKELEDWLLNYVKSPAFIESLRELRDLATVPVEARLRVNKKINYHKDDVMVVVSKDDQEKLGKARLGEDVSLRVKRIDFPGNGSLRGEGYEVLNSAGIFVDVLKPNLIDGETIEIFGRRSA